MLTWSLFQVTLPSPTDETAITIKVEVEVDDLKVENEEEEIRTEECVQDSGKNDCVHDGIILHCRQSFCGQISNI